MADLDSPSREVGPDVAGRGIVLLWASGVGYAVLDFIGNSVVASLPGAPVNDSVSVAPFLARHETTIGLMAWLIGFSTVLLAVFAVSVGLRLKGFVAADVVAATGVLTAAILAVSSGALLMAAGERDSDQAEMLWDVTNASLVATLPAAVMVLCVSLAVLHHHSGPPWVWRTGFPLALLCLVPYIGWVNLKLFPIWIAALSISLVRQRRWRSIA